MSVLDDLKMIHQRDTSDALGVAEKQYVQLQKTYGVACRPKVAIKDIVVAGMGGSALAASTLQSWLRLPTPLEIVRNYDLPAYIGPETLFIASSYSGNTEETLEALSKAESKNAQIVVVTAGGKLATRAQEKNYPLYLIPSGVQPRMAVLYNLAALIELLVAVELIEPNKIEELHSAADWLGDAAKQFLPTVPSSQNPAKQLALELVGSSIVIYAGPKMSPAAYKWKINFNENAKTVAWYNVLPEFHHNELLGWTSHPIDKPYKVVDLRSSLEHPRVQKRFEITQKLLSGLRPEPEVVNAQGDSVLKQLLWTIQFGDFVSLYLALLNGLDPTPVELIEKLKRELSKNE